MYSETTSVGQLVKDLTIGESPETYDRVIIYAGTDEDGNKMSYRSPANTFDSLDGGIFEIDNEWGSQEMADAILGQISGWEYHPYDASGAYLDPIAELGDGITIGGIYSGVYNRSTTFDNIMLAKVSAPSAEETVHEYGYESSIERKFQRSTATQKAMLTLVDNKVDAKVTLDDGTTNNSFGWELTHNKWEINANNKAILRATIDGLEVEGKIRAGRLGDETDGFNITSRSIYKGYGISSESSPSFHSIGDAIENESDPRVGCAHCVGMGC